MDEHFFIRPVSLNDTETIHKFATDTALGMISLPRNEKLLENNLKHSVASFSNNISKPEDEFYLFALENKNTGHVGGCCGIYSRSGVNYPYHYYKIDTMKENKVVSILRPHVESAGPSELCALYITPKWRKHGLGKLLSFSRLLFIASHQKRFHQTLSARLRGVIHKRKKTSPFWSNTGQVLLGIDFSDVSQLVEDHKNFLPDYLLKTPLIANLLPKEAREVIGEPHQTSKPAMEMLLEEGFAKTKDVDLFDAGPVLNAELKQLKTLNELKTAQIKEISLKDLSGTKKIISNTKTEFRTALGKVKKSGQENVILSKTTADLLQVEKGDTIQYV